MINLEIERHEKIILSCANNSRLQVGETAWRDILYLVLTNKNIIYVWNREDKLSQPDEPLVHKKQISSVDLVEDVDGFTIVLVNGECDHIDIGFGNKKKNLKWVEAIRNLLGAYMTENPGM